jgi:hypothetical protein
MDVTYSGCPSAGTAPKGAPQPTGGFPGTTADGFDFSGSDPFPSGSETWSFKGTPTS